jgi:hypothetical protein
MLEGCQHIPQHRSIGIDLLLKPLHIIFKLNGADVVFPSDVQAAEAFNLPDSGGFGEINISKINLLTLTSWRESYYLIP